jgi:hypothetical protein
MNNTVILTPEQMEQLKSGQAITLQPPETHTYPIYAKNVYTACIVKFESLNTGTVVEACGGTYEQGYTSTILVGHTVTSTWKILPDYKEDTMFKARRSNAFFCGLDEESEKSCHPISEKLNNYSLFTNRSEALEFDAIRKQVAIQFEFLKQHAPAYEPDFSLGYIPKYYVIFNTATKTWSKDFCKCIYTPGTVYMPQDVANKFCELANKGLIRGLATPYFEVLS